MKRLSILIALLGAAALVSAQPQTGIAGTVTDAETGQPIAGARVHAMHGGMAVTDSSGAYLIQLTRPGAYVVAAGAPDYQMATYPDTVVVEQGQVVEGIDFALEPCQQQGLGAISGTVTDAETGEPIEGARVHTFHMVQAYTNEHGYYLLDSLPAGDYIVTASAPDYQSAVYPDTVTVVEGQTTEDIDFALDPCTQEYGSLGGAVTDAGTGAIIRGAVVTAENENTSREVVQGCRGYNIGMLPPGMYWVSAEAPGYEPGAYAESVEVMVGQRTEHVDFALEPDGQGGGGITGTVTNSETGDPLVGAHVVANGPARGMANTNPEGVYLIGDLPDGVYAVHAMARGFEPSAPETVEVVAGQTVEHVDFALLPSGAPEVGFVAGMVVDSATGEPIFNALVYARGPRGQGMAHTDSSGEYLMRVQPGTYVMRACARQYFPQVYPDSVVVAAGETVFGIDFELAQTPRFRTGIAGFVIDGYTGEEVGGVLVTAIGSEGSFETVTDELGEYRFDDLDPGDYRIRVSGSGYQEQLYPDLVVADPDEVEAFTTPWLYPLNGVQENPVSGPSVASRIEVQPNPFCQSATVRWQVPAAGHVRLIVTDVSGRVVATLQDGTLGAGRYSATWNGAGTDGRRVADGIYFYQLDAPGSRAMEKVVLMAR